jgi:hypothetical protein
VEKITAREKKGFKIVIKNVGSKAIQNLYDRTVEENFLGHDV